MLIVEVDNGINAAAADRVHPRCGDQMVFNAGALQIGDRWVGRRLSMTSAEITLFHLTLRSGYAGLWAVQLLALKLQFLPYVFLVTCGVMQQNLFVEGCFVF